MRKGVIFVIIVFLFFIIIGLLYEIDCLGGYCLCICCVWIGFVLCCFGVGCWKGCYINSLIVMGNLVYCEGKKWWVEVVI